jgi:hypothetical protein
MNINTTTLDTFTSTKAVFTLHVVPEPNTALLLSLGLTGLAARRRSLPGSAISLLNSRDLPTRCLAGVAETQL